MMNYAQALRTILERTDYERGPRPPYVERMYRLDRVRELLAVLGDPHLSYPTVHVAGTKGKGSTTAMIAAMLSAAGYAVGMYTSPHLHTFRERMRVSDGLISEDELVALVQRMQPALVMRPEVTVFEVITALAMLYFAEKQVDVAVFEVGLGGRLDATNVIAPEVSVISSISLDHVNVLGNTLAAIAREKAGIIKQNTPVISAAQKPEALAVIQAIAAEHQAPLTVVGQDWCCQALRADEQGQEISIYRLGSAQAPEYALLHLPLLGEHQAENACLAVAAVDALKGRGFAVSNSAIAVGLSQVVWPGRMELLGRAPLVMVDGAHNGDSIQRLLSSLKRHLQFERLRVILGIGAGHQPGELVQLVANASDELLLTRSRHVRAVPTQELVALAAEHRCSTSQWPTVAEALAHGGATALPSDLILVTGSLFVVAEAREAWFADQGWPQLPSDPPGIY